MATMSKPALICREFYLSEEQESGLSSTLDAFAHKFLDLQSTLKTANQEGKQSPEYFKWLDFDYLAQINEEQTKTAAKQTKNQGVQKALIVGMGGSGVNSLVLNNTLRDFNPLKKGIEILVQNNLDPSSLLTKLESLKASKVLEQTQFVLVSKSGSTDELRRNLNTILDFLKQYFNNNQETALLRFAKQAIIITEPKLESKKNFLHELRAEILTKTGIEIPYLENHPFIGGRFSMFSPVGMYTAELMELDSSKMLESAKKVWVDFCSAKSIHDSIIAKLASLDITLYKSSYYARYSMVYSDSLEALNKFRAQLKGESLNKDGIDSTIHIAGIGSVNHHSDLELLFKNNNKLVLEQISFAQVSVDHQNQDTGLKSLDDLRGQFNHQSLIDNHLTPLKQYLAQKKIPLISTVLAKQDEASLASFLMEDMLVTVVQAGLQDAEGSYQKLDLAIRQWEVEKYKSAIRDAKTIGA